MKIEDFKRTDPLLVVGVVLGSALFHLNFWEEGFHDSPVNANQISSEEGIYASPKIVCELAVRD